MRKSLEAISLAGLAFIFWITYQAFTGPNPLPSRIPTHFDAAGNANAWGPPATMWFLPMVAVAIYLVITVISLLPTGFKSMAVRVTAENRARLEALTHQLIACIKLEMICLFAWLQWSILQTVLRGSGTISPIAVPIFMVAVFATVGWHMVAIFRAVRARSAA
ncbi:MAG: DUF1648 domain-containing protein [Terracidiphilus sp.]|jgi:uncharacterized membrane protein